MLITLEVTQEDIAAGVKQNCYECPISKALTRMGYSNVLTSTLGILGTINDIRYRCRIPPEALVFIGDFDKGKTVSPFTFNIDFAPVDLEKLNSWTWSLREEMQ